MKKLLLLVLLLPLVPVAAYSQSCTGLAKLNKHIYKPERLVEKKGCITVKGIIKKKVKEKDGDFHVRLLLDPGQDSDLINDKNKSQQGGFFVFEPICVLPVTQTSAKKACKGYKQAISLPNVGDHVEVTGIHVLDTEHGWLEMHPVTKIKVTPKLTP
jgi:hypothetical protein